uniref:Putative secreted protein n=1 Tax=Anopheles darlingi TaxID=43151 RepID=A0A2M4DI98_ANODA
MRVGLGQVSVCVCLGFRHTYSASSPVACVDWVGKWTFCFPFQDIISRHHQRRSSKCVVWGSVASSLLLA